MEFHQVRYFLAIIREGNFTRAARACFVSQPSLSQQILKLEGELGQPLFHRMGRRAVATEAGERFRSRAERIVAEIENSQRELEELKDSGGRLVIGGIPSVVPYLLPRVLEKLRTHQPGLAVELREDLRGPIIDAVVGGELDLALISRLGPIADLLFEPVMTEPLLLVLPSDHRLAGQAEVAIGSLRDEPFIFLGEASSLGHQVARFFGDVDFRPKVVGRCAQVRTVKSMVARGLGISVLPSIAALSGEDSELAYRRLCGLSPYREIGIIRHPQRFLGSGARVFVRELKELAAAVTAKIRV